MKHTIRMAILSSIAIFPFFKAISLPHILGTLTLFIISASFVFTLYHRTPFPYKMTLKSMTCLFQARKKTGTTEDPCLLEDLLNRRIYSASSSINGKTPSREPKGLCCFEDLLDNLHDSCVS